jgi:hypothetical protein
MSSVKFDVKETVASVTGRQDLANEVGNVVAKGAGAGGYLAVRVCEHVTGMRLRLTEDSSHT